MEETVVMRDNNDAFALLFEFRKKDRVKILPEFRILLCGPFVKQHKRLIVQTTDDISQPFFLPGG